MYFYDDFLFLALLFCAYSSISHHPSPPNSEMLVLLTTTPHYLPFFCLRTLLEIPTALHCHFLLSFLPPLRSSIRLLHFCIFPNSFSPPCKLLPLHYFPTPTCQSRNKQQPKQQGRIGKAEGNSRGTCIGFGGGGKKSVYHNERETVVLTQHTWLSRETICFLCPKYFTGLGTRFCSLPEKPRNNSCTF